MNAIQKFINEEDGAAAVEYGLMVALIAAVIAATIVPIGAQLKIKFCTIVTTLGGVCPT